MSSRRLAILAALVVLVAAAAFWRSHPRASSHDVVVGQKILPELASRLDAVSSVRLFGAATEPLVSLERAEGRWRVKESDYPADAARVRRLLVALGELHVMEAKTAEPSLYPALGVEDPAAAGARSVRLELGGLERPLGLIVGHAAGTQGTFVRVPGAAQAFEARPGIDAPRTPHDWLARGFLDIAPTRVASVRVTRSDEPAWDAERGDRSAAHFNVPNLPHGAELTNAGAADAAANAFAGLEFDEVRPAVAPAAGAKRHRATLRAFDGLVIEVSANADGTEHWLGVAASFDAAAAQRFAAGAARGAPDAAATTREAADINATTGGHEYRIPAYRFDAIFRPRRELLRH